MPSLIEPCWSSACISAKWSDKSFGRIAEGPTPPRASIALAAPEVNAGLAERGLYRLYEEFRRTFPRAGVVVLDKSIVGQIPSSKTDVRLRRVSALRSLHANPVGMHARQFHRFRARRIARQHRLLQLLDNRDFMLFFRLPLLVAHVEQSFV